jgi:AcrR family transcriptional regulator
MDKKERLLEAALKLFNIYGFDNTPTSQISKEAGVATGTLFNYFESKEELINVLYLTCKDSLIQMLLIGVNSESSLRSKFRCVYLNYIHWSLNNKGAFLFFQQFYNSPYIVAKTREEGLVKLNALVDLIHEGVEQDIIKDVDLDYLSVIISGLFNSNAQYYLDNNNLSQNEEFLEVSFNFIWDSIRR